MRNLSAPRPLTVLISVVLIGFAVASLYTRLPDDRAEGRESQNRILPRRLRNT
jgi:hypothetical protein